MENRDYYLQKENEAKDAVQFAEKENNKLDAYKTDPNEQFENLKVKINTFVWVNARESLTLGKADDLAMAILQLFADHEAV